MAEVPSVKGKTPSLAAMTGGLRSSKHLHRAQSTNQEWHEMRRHAHADATDSGDRLTMASFVESMFRETTVTLDFKVVGERVSLELARIRRAKKKQRAYPAVGAIKVEFSGDRSDPNLPREARMLARQIAKKLSGWTWCFYHLPAIWRTASTAQTHATAAQAEAGAAQAAAGAARAEAREAREATQVLSREAREAAQVLSSQIAALRREIMFQQRRLTRLSGSTGLDKSSTASEEAARTAAGSDRRLDSLYVAFEDVFRGTREDIKGRVGQYLDRLVLAGAGQNNKPILDAGCGRGEWLEILKEAGLTAYGIDSNLMMVERSASLGLNVVHGDLLEHLRSLEEESRSAITAFHVVEHLPLEVLVDFLDEALRVLAPGGLLLLETPNPENIRVGATTFYSDPTHRNPIPPETLRFIVEHRGFTETEIVRLHPDASSDQLQGDDGNFRHLNALLFGPRDYSIVARRI
jgi:SAM-dependent methyltransferase